MDSRSDDSQVVVEIWIEQLKIIVNEINGAEESATPRTAINHFGTVEIPDAYCDLAREFVSKKSVFEESSARLFSSVKSRLAQNKSQHTKIV